MGQAKRRGTFEQRYQQALEKQQKVLSAPIEYSKPLRRIRSHGLGHRTGLAAVLALACALERR